MLYGCPPFKGRNNAHTSELIKQGKLRFLSQRAQLSVLARDLISKLLVVDPTQRLSAEEALCHPWLSGEAPVESLAHLIMDDISTFQRTQRLQDVLLPLSGAHVEERDLYRLRRAFRKADSDGTGFITLEQVQQVLDSQARSGRRRRSSGVRDDTARR